MKKILEIAKKRKNYNTKDALKLLDLSIKIKSVAGLDTFGFYAINI